MLGVLCWRYGVRTKKVSAIPQGQARIGVAHVASGAPMATLAEVGDKEKTAP